LLAAIVVPIQLAMALLMANVVSRLETGRSAALYIFAIPLGISDLAAGLIWLAIFDQSGFLNTLLSNLGVVDRPIMFLGYQSKLTIFIAVALAEIWRATAIMMVILVAGMGLIPKEYYEAAEVFGAGPWKRFVRITLPLLRPSLQTAIILRVILAFEVFAVVAALGGTNLPVLMGETYNWQFTLQDRNVAAALGAAHPGHLDRLHAVLPQGAACAQRGADMSAVTQAPAASTTDARKAGDWLLVATAILLCVWVLLPIYLLIVNALSSPDQVTAFPKRFFPAFDLGSLSFFVNFAGVARALWNSVLVATLTMILSIGFGARPATRCRALISGQGHVPFPGADDARLPAAAAGAAAGGDVHPHRPRRYRIGLALVHTTLALPFAVLITFSLFSGIPVELEEAAWTLGCTRLQAFRKVILPLALPGIAASAVFAFTISWNEVFAAAVLTIENRTLTAFLLQSLGESPLYLKFAGGAALVVPALIFIFAVRKYLFAMWGIANR